MKNKVFYSEANEPAIELLKFYNDTQIRNSRILIISKNGEQTSYHYPKDILTIELLENEIKEPANEAVIFSGNMADGIIIVYNNDLKKLLYIYKDNQIKENCICTD